MSESLETSSAASHASKSLPLVIGIGSPHGDDQVGWEVIERLNSHADCRWLGEFRKAAVPHDVLDWLDSERSIHLVDALASDVQQLLRLTITRTSPGGLQASFRDENEIERDCLFPRLQSNSTHQFGLLPVLQLADALGNLPQQLVLWAIPIGAIPPNLNSQSPRTVESTEHLVNGCLQRIRSELGLS